MQLCLAFSPPNSLTECRELWFPAWDGANGRKEFAALPNHHKKDHLPNRYICFGLCCN